MILCGLIGTMLWWALAIEKGYIRERVDVNAYRFELIIFSFFTKIEMKCLVFSIWPMNNTTTCMYCTCS